MAALFHRRFEAKNGFEPVQAGFAVRQEATERMPLYEPPAAASNQLGQRRRPLELLLEERSPLIGHRKEPKDPIVVRDRLTQRNDAAMEPRGPLDLPEEGHPAALVPHAIDEIERVGRATDALGRAREPLGVGHELDERPPPVGMRGGRRMPLDVAANVHLEAEPVTRIDQISNDLRLRGLPRDEAVGVSQTPASFL